MVARRRRQGETGPDDAGQGQASVAPRRGRRPKSQAWFWTPGWQAKEREADDTLAVGRVRRFLSEDEFLAELEAVDAEERTKDAHVRSGG